MRTETPIELWELQDSPYCKELELARQAQNFIGWSNMLKGQIAKEWGDIQMRYYTEFYEAEVPVHVSATWWASELVWQLLYLTLATWQHHNYYLHNTLDKAKKIQDRTDAVEEMVHWYKCSHDLPVDDKHNFSRFFLEQCTDTTAQICLWLGNIVDIHKHNMCTTLHGYFSQAE